MNRLPVGYTSRGDGTYEKRITFMELLANGTVDRLTTETLVRSRTGRLLRVERTRNALSRRAPADA